MIEGAAGGRGRDSCVLGGGGLGSKLASLTQCSDIKRQLRETWAERLERIPAGRDYVLIVKPGMPEAVAASGFEWPGERVDRVLGQGGA